jgi:hypothetical protein
MTGNPFVDLLVQLAIFKSNVNKSVVVYLH